MLLKVLLFSGLAGVVGTTMGGLICVLIKKPTNRLLSNLFYMSSGVMLGLSFLQLLNESMDIAPIPIVGLGVVIGAAMILIIENLVVSDEKIKEKINNLNTNETMDMKKMNLLGFMLFLSISLHNLPEGLAIGVGVELEIGLATALSIGLHNIPEGIAIGLPMKMGNSKSLRIIKYCFFTGLPTILGGLIGYLIGSISPIILALCLAIAAGSMICVVFLEMIPKAIELHPKFDVYSASSLFLGIIITLFLMLL